MFGWIKNKLDQFKEWRLNNAKKQFITQVEQYTQAPREKFFEKRQGVLSRIRKNPKMIKSLNTNEIQKITEMFGHNSGDQLLVDVAHHVPDLVTHISARQDLLEYTLKSAAIHSDKKLVVAVVEATQNQDAGLSNQALGVALGYLVHNVNKDVKSKESKKAISKLIENRSGDEIADIVVSAIRTKGATSNHRLQDADIKAAVLECSTNENITQENLDEAVNNRVNAQQMQAPQTDQVRNALSQTQALGPSLFPPRAQNAPGRGIE